MSEIDGKQFMISRRADNEIMLEDVTHGYPPTQYFIVRAELASNGDAEIGIYKLIEKVVKE